MLTAVTELSFVARVGFAVLQTPPQESKWLPDFVHRLTPTEWVIITVAAVVLLGVILYFFTIDGIELGFPPKITFKRRGRAGKVESEIQVAASAPQAITQTASSYGMNVGHDLTGPTFTGEIHGDVIIGARPESEKHPAKEPSESGLLPPNLVHPYPLQANFTGRVSERKELTAWLADDEHPICELVAMGGMGKSALTWFWLTRDVLPSSDVKLDGVMWWSFYEGESSFAKFVDDALKYASDKPIDTELLPTTYDRAQELRKQLQTKRVLFVLDGFERQLRAYASLDAAYKSHDAEPSSEARSCVDPISTRLLRDIAAVTTRAKVLLTSRLTVSDLEDRAGDALAGVVERELKELACEDAITFMRAQGVKKGTDTEISNICEGYGYHALSLRLLSGLIVRDAKMPGDIAAVPRHEVFEDLVQRQHHVLEQSYDALPKKERALLSRIAAFRGPMTYDALAIFNTLGNEKRFEDGLETLRVRGLLQRDSERFDLHPIVRHYAYDRLSDKTGVHSRLRDYFAKIPAPDEEQVKSVEDLAPVIELYYHTVGAGRYDEARELFRDRLAHGLYYRLGAYQTHIELLRLLFPDGEHCPPMVSDEQAQAWTYNALANSYSVCGQPRRAMRFFEQGVSIRGKQTTKGNLATTLLNIAVMAQVLLGELERADENLLRSLELCSETKNTFLEAATRSGRGWLLCAEGAFSDADSELQRAQVTFDRIQTTNFSSVVRSLRALLLLLDGHGREALEFAQEARTKANMVSVERDIVQAEWLIGAALVMEQEVNAAAEHLTNALERCRRSSLVEFEPDILLAWARWHRAGGNTKEAEEFADEALEIADRCEYRLKQADIHNFLARLALEAGDQEKAREEAEIAKERAWCDGPPHCYKPALDEAEKMLKELGA